MMKRSPLLLTALLCSSRNVCVLGDVAPPYPNAIYEKQPDGSDAVLALHGHPYHGAFQTDELGHPVVRDDDGWYVYALHDDTKVSPITGRQHLRPSNYIVGIHPPPYNEPPDLRKLSPTHDDDGIGHIHDDTLLQERKVGTNATFRKINDMLCDGMPRTAWCPQNPINIKSLSRSSSMTNDLSGVLNLVVILVKFSDQADRPLSPVSDYERLFMDPTWGPTGPVSKYFETLSGGKFKVSAHVEDWTVSPNSEEYWSFGHHGTSFEFAAIANKGLEAMDRRGTDWSQYDRDGDGVIDGLFIIHSGYAAEGGGTDSFNGKDWGLHRIWSHRSGVGSNNAWRSADRSVRIGNYGTTSAFLKAGSKHITRIGVVVHEIGHMLGLPDMLMAANGNGVGNYDTMGNMWGRDASQLYPGIMSAWSRIFLGWATPTELFSPGTFTVAAALDNPNTVYKITHGFPDGEYLLIENRVQRAYDLQSHDEGLLIWHIDETNEKMFMESPGYPGQVGWPQNGNHYQLAVIQADQSYGLEQGIDLSSAGDLYKAGSADLGPGTCLGCSTTVFPNTDSYSYGNVQASGVRLTGFSDPGDVMTFTFLIDGTPAPPSRLRGPLIPLIPPKRPTPSPTPRATSSPTMRPTPLPTKPPTPSPSKFPTRPPTPLPTKPPTLQPTRFPTNLPTGHPTRYPTRPPTRFPTRPPTPSPTSPPGSSSNSLASNRPVFDTISVEQDPDWWQGINAVFDGTEPLKQCNQRDEIPITKSSCGESSKTCFFGTKECPGVGASPIVKCVCADRSWECVEVVCDIVWQGM